MAGFVHPKVTSPSASVRTVKDAINAIAARGNKQARLRNLEIEQLDEMLGQRTQLSLQTATQQPYMYDSQAALRSHPAGDMQITDFDDLFFDDFAFGTELTEPQMMDLAEALTAGDFGMLGR